jgi:hypothetical protein
VIVVLDIISRGVTGTEKDTQERSHNPMPVFNADSISVDYCRGCGAPVIELHGKSGKVHARSHVGVDKLNDLVYARMMQVSAKDLHAYLTARGDTDLSDMLEPYLEVLYDGGREFDGVRLNPRREGRFRSGETVIGDHQNPEFYQTWRADMDRGVA